ncbi:ricin-type beta-trefoil lectin domain protein [Kitasatospora sp. SUK 42]|uniref:ricin-type beta-trefoil lectin domain protein n=1 Tax=Kitasatospora sp. SUK 42 TaxID=1588882 RepID=UPI0018C9B10D|nr:ricin-type beta-trefoil lectin domain protein [Kitasatospora sp. SUK 42]MBV2155147.1 ricin-type beta-trefoil lectin domain protein [Kitasatospora sp. SUK 42]
MTVAALTAVISLMVPLTGEGVAAGAQAVGQGKDKLPQLPRVSGHDADGKRAREALPRPAGSRDLQAHTPSPVTWPTGATVTVDLGAKAGTEPAPGLAAKDKGDAAAVRAGSTPVLLRPASPERLDDRAKAAAGAEAGTSAPASVEVRVADRAQAQKANVDGLLVALKRADGGKDAASLDVVLDYGAIADAYGGGWASRLRLVAMPACAMTTPELAECRTRQPLDSSIDPATKKISGMVALPGDAATPSSSSPERTPATGTASVTSAGSGSGSGGGAVVAAVSGTGGSQGSYTATDLSASGSWAQTPEGAFTYNYPITTPPSLAGEGPGVALSYNSQAVDGETSARNSQASWLGDGWSYSPGFIERVYKPCKNAGIDDSGDQCWAGWNATLSLGSHSGQLIRDDSGLYHLLSDDGTRIERLTGATNGMWQGEYYKVTTTDGAAYYFGLNHAPGTTTDAATNSAWAAPVYHPNSGDPCYTAAKGKNSQCDQQPGWRFNLDFVVDPHGNLQRFDWANETNRYAMGAGQVASSGGGGTLTPYTRGGYLTRVSYGYQLADSLAGREPSARVDFDTAERCVVSDTVCRAENLSATTASNWPDVPYDLTCQDGWTTTGTGPKVCQIGSPTFWSTKRLSAIRTATRTAGGWQDVDRYDLKHLFSDAGGTYDPVTGKTPDKQNAGSLQSVMWLSEIKRTALDTSAGGSGTIALDSVTFAGTEVDNRVDGLTPAAPSLYRPRIIGVNTESGTSIAVTYRDPECSRVKGTMPASADSNTMACYPVYWTTPGGGTPIADWFHKTLVAKVSVSDTTKSNSPNRVTSYDYRDAAWHRDDSELTDDQYRTWNEFRGYRTVTTTTGADPDPIGQTTVTYFQGMDGDYKADKTKRVVKLRNSLGEETEDSNWLAGAAQETITYTQAGGTPVAKQLSDAPVLTVTATRTRTAWTSKKDGPQGTSGGSTKPELSTLPPLEAHRPKSAGARSSVLLSDQKTWRTGRTTTSFDDLGRANKADTQPDVTTSADRTCTTTTYATPPAGNPMMLAYPSEILTVAGGCDTAASDRTTISDRRLIYDGGSDPKNPGGVGTLGQNGSTVGYATATQVLKGYDGQGNATYQTVAAQEFDAYGRVVRSVDAAGAVNLTAYTPAGGLLPTEISTTSPLGWTAKSVISPARGLVTRAVDANGRTTDSTYDALGRRTAVWLPGNSKDAGKKADRTFGYEMHGVDATPSTRANPPAVTTNTQRENGSYSTSVTIYDGFLQPRQTQTTPANAADGRVITSTRYDGHGQVSKSTAAWSEPTTGPGTTLFEEIDNTVPSQTRTVYDGMGRPVASKLFAKATELWQSTTAYPGAERTDTTSPSGGTPSTVYTDALGRTASSVLHGGDGVGDVTTTYTYDQRGKPATIADNAGNTWTYTYDVQGNRISQSDPDAGTSTTAYDDLGRAVSTTDGRGKQISFTYDLLGRTTGRYEGTDTSDKSKQLASVTYDTLAKGYPTSATRYVGGASGDAYVQAITGYTTRYQPISTTTTIPAVEGKLAGTYTQTASYTDNIGLLAGITYNADAGLPTEKLGFTRDLQGEIVQTGTDTTKLLDRANYNALGQLLLSTYGTRGELLRTARTYDDATARLTTSSVKFQESDANPVSFTSYGYNPAGNLTSVSELQSSGGTDQTYDTQCFRYDGLGRLSEAWTDAQGVSTPGAGQVSHCNADSVVIKWLGGPAPYWQSFQYNLLGDRTQQIRHDVTGDTSRDVTQTSSYPGTDRTPAAKPNTVTSVTSRTGSPTSTVASAMPGNGNVQLCLDVAGGRTADGTAVQTWTCNGTGAQKWTRPGDGTLRSLGKCARPAGGNAGAGTPIELVTCDGSDSQKWQDGADGALVHTASTLCLDIPGWNQNPGTQIGLWYCTGNPNQKWPTTANPPTGPSYTSTLSPQYDAQGNTSSRSNTSTTSLPSAIPTGTKALCLDVPGSQTANGTGIQTWGCNSSPAQNWTIGTDGMLRAFDKCARPVGGNAGSGAQIELWSCDPNDAGQQWRAATDGALVNKASGLCLDVPGGNVNQGTRVVLWTCNQGPNQKWGFQNWGSGTTQPVAGATQAITYNVEGRTETVTTPNGDKTATSRYLYDADGGLLIQHGPDGTILYLFGGAEQLTLSPDGTTVSGTRYYSQPDGTRIVRLSGGALTYQLSNPQNTSTLQVDAGTRAVTRRAFDPYGNPRGAVPASWADNRGFLGKPVDTGSGLNLLGARNYDATLGRFLSADPLLASGNPDQMGGYTYGNNNPVNLTDPSGLIPGWMKSVGKFVAGAVDQGVGWVTEHSPFVAMNNFVAGTSSSIGQQTGVPVFPGVTPMQQTSHPVADLFNIPHNDPAYVAGEITEAAVELAVDGVGLVKGAVKGARFIRSAVKEAGGVKNALSKLLPKKGGPKAPPEEPHIPKTSPGDPKPPATPKSEPTPVEEPAGPACSFTPDTPVLMADGSTKPIGRIKVGDRVESADQTTAEDQGGRAVIATLVHDDEDLLDLTVTANGVTSTIKTTSNHPFWDATAQTWVPAGELTVGHVLTTDKGEPVTVTAVHSVDDRAQMYNLTVAQLHTYYVLAGTSPILVHNKCDVASEGGEGEATVHLANYPDGRQHALITVTDGEGTISTHQNGWLGSPSNGVEHFEVSQLPAITINVRVPLPRPGGARAAIESAMYKTERGVYPAYSLPEQGCMSYCAGVLRAGGISDIPTHNDEAQAWLLARFG